MQTLSSLWAYEVRLLPVLFALAVFYVIQLLRRYTNIEYTPSYIAVFPLSMIQGQLADYFGERMYGQYLSIKSGERKRNNALFIKAWISIFLTFLMVPLITGFLAALILSPKEFVGFLVVLVSIEFLRCCNAIYDFKSYRDPSSAGIIYFVAFYFTYVGSLWYVCRLSHRFAVPFAETGDYSGLFAELEYLLVPFIAFAFFIAVVTNVLAHLLVNKDTVKPSWEGSSEEDESEEPNRDD